MKKFVVIIVSICWFGLLTLLSQVGGFVWLIAWGIGRWFPMGRLYTFSNLSGEYDYATDCENKGHWYISLDKTLAELFYDPAEYLFDAGKTRTLAILLAEHPAIGKILIQPHLEKRLGLERYSKFRQQGCQAARHDDHFHVQL
jgi:hypothetical protein